MNVLPKHILCLVCCLFILCPVLYNAQGQAPVITRETFLKKIETAPSDTTRIQALLEYGSWLIDYNKDSAVLILQKALLLSRQQQYTFGEGRSHQLQGVAYAEKGDYAKALVSYNKAVAAYRRINDHLLLGKVYNNIGNVYNNQSRLEEATEFYISAIRHMEMVKQYPYVIYSNLSTALRKLRQYDKAIHYSQLGLLEAKNSKDTSALIILLSATSDAMVQSGHINESVPVSREMLFLSERINHTVGKAVALLNIADYHDHLKQHDSALSYLQKAFALARQAGDPVYIEEAHYGLAKTQLALGQYEQSRQNLLQSLRIAKQLSDGEHLAKTYDLLSQLHAARGKFEKSLEAFRKSKAYDDSLRSEATTRNIQFLETKYRTSEKDKELTQKQLSLTQKIAEIKTKNSMIWLALTGLVALTVISVLGYRSYRQKQKLQAQQILTLKKENETKALQALMQGEERERIRIARDLHDGVGSMLSALKMYISSLSEEHKPIAASATYQDAVSLLSEAASEVRKTAHNLMPQLLHQQGLEEALRAFCIKINKSNALLVEFQSYGMAGQRFSPDFELMVFRLIQELLNNTLRHAEATQALVQLSLSLDMLTITVEDNGKGFNVAAVEQGGIGLQTVRSRVHAFDGTIDFDSEEGSGTTAYIEFHLEKVKTACVS